MDTKARNCVLLVKRTEVPCRAAQSVKSRSYAALLRQLTTVKPEKKDADWPNRITGITVGINSSTTDLLKAPESVNKTIKTTQIQLRERPMNRVKTCKGDGLPPQRQYVKYEHRKIAVSKDQVTAHKGCGTSSEAGSIQYRASLPEAGKSEDGHNRNQGKAGCAENRSGTGESPDGER